MKKHLANIITASRIVISFLLFCFEELGVTYLAVYFYLGLSDVLDGFVARRTNNKSKAGAMLDSVADIVFLSVVVITLFNEVVDLLAGWLIWLIVIIALIRITAYAIGLIRFKHFTALHTALNKVSGLLLFAIPFFINFWIFTKYIVAFSFFIQLSAIEELLIELKMKEYNADIKSIIFLKNRHKS